MNALPRLLEGISHREPRAIARAISLIEENSPEVDRLLDHFDSARFDQTMILGITGPPGAGKSTLVDQLILAYRAQSRRVGVVAIDPSSELSGGALLGDRIRMMRHATDPDVILRSMASRGRGGGVCAAVGGALRIMAEAGCNPLLIETVGVGQTESTIARLADLTLLVLAPGFGDDVQAMKAGLIELADVLVVNKADLAGADSLCHDLQAVTETRGSLLCRTSARTGAGINELVEAVQSLHETRRESGAHRRRRKAMILAEAEEVAIEHLRRGWKDQLQSLEVVPENPFALAQLLLRSRPSVPPNAPLFAADSSGNR